MNNTFFPSPIPDESGFGLVERAAKLRNFTSFAAFLKSEIPDVKVNSRGSAQGCLNLLVHWLGFGAGLPLSSILARYSNLPLYRPFMHCELEICDVTSGWASRESERYVYDWFLPLGSRVDDLRFCPKCAAEQDQKYGITSWLRAHQIPEITVCWRHGCNLHLLHSSNSKLEFPPVDKQISHETVEITKEQRFAQAMKDLMDADLPWLSSDDRAALYREQLFEIEHNGKNEKRAQHALTLLSDPKLGTLLLPGSRLTKCDPMRNLKLITGLFASIPDFVEAFKRKAAEKAGSSQARLLGTTNVENVKLLYRSEKQNDARKPLFQLKPVIGLNSQAQFGRHAKTLTSRHN